jgi:hypothetical protein
MLAFAIDRFFCAANSDARDCERPMANSNASRVPSFGFIPTSLADFSRHTSIFGADAYFEARRREQESSSDAIAKDWDQIALAVARRRVDVDPSIRVAMNAVLVSDREARPVIELKSSRR